MTRRALLTALLLLAVPVPAHAGTAYITSSGTYAIDTATGRRGEMAPPGGSMVVTPDNKTVYMFRDNALYPLDTASNTLGAAISVPTNSHSIAITPDGGTVLVTNELARVVTPIATATNQPGTPISVDRPTDLAVAPDGRTAYVLTAGNTVTPIELATQTVQPQIALAHEPEAIAITPDGALAVVSESEGNAGFVQVIDLATGTPEAPVSLSAQPAGDVAMAPDGSIAYVVADPVYGTVDPFFPAVEGTIYPFTIATRTVGAKLFGSTLYRTTQLAAGAAGDRLYGVQRCTSRRCFRGYVFDLRLSDPDGPTTLDDFEDPYVGPSVMVLAPSPAAFFTVAAAPAYQVTSFDAVGSNNDGGSIVSYTWDFGDGTVDTTYAASAKHRYDTPGTYTVKLTTTNAGGCASRFVYTGQSALCNGSPTATTTRQVTIGTPGAAATTDSAEAITRTGATLFGTIGRTPGLTDWHFEYGTTTSYGKATAPTRGSGAVKAAIIGLKPDTVYHYRLVVATERGTPPVNSGSDRTFKTAAAGALRLQATTLRLHGKSVTVALRCASDFGCRGKLKLTSGKRTCATGKFRLKANQRAKQRLTVRRACRSKRSARLTSTVTTGQQNIAATVRVKR